MAALMRHRGPDGEGYAVFDPRAGERRVLAGPETPAAVLESGLPHAPRERLEGLPDGFTVGLGHRRLSIIDLSPGGHQPLCDPTGRYWISFNGEIYNYRELRRELEAMGLRFAGDSDTEVALAAYMAHGQSCQERFNGMWAILIWDCLEKTLWMSRDRFGVKPLFYIDHPRFFAAASEIKSFLPLISLDPDPDEIHAYLADGPSEAHEATMFAGVRRFPAGHCAVLSADGPPGGLAPRRFYELPQANLDTSFSMADLDRHAQAYRELLKDAVRLRLHADVKVSCALSGGLDSSSITLLATDVLAELGAQSRLATVSNVYADPLGAACDESRFVDQVAALLPVDCLKTEPRGDGILAVDDLALWHYENLHDDIPVSSLATFGLCRASGLTVNLDGQGADESLAGYLRYFADYLAHPPGRGVEFWRTFFRAPIPLKAKLSAAAGIPTRPGTSALERLAAPRLDPDYRLSRRVSAIFPDQPLNLTLRDNILGSLPKLLRNVDCHSMFHSVESRQPYLDYRLIEYLLQVPLTYKIRDGWTKYLARVAFKDRLPEAVVWRKDKMGWPQPLRQWLAPLMTPGGPMDRVILGSGAVKDMLGGVPPGVLDELRLHYRPYARLYNLARHLAIFHEIAPDALARGQSPRDRLSGGTP
jgi:asparagine synthase (glutamine-hydrolysing)